MGELADQLTGLVVTVRSPDGNITARIRGRGEVEVRFRSGTFSEYLESALAHQLSQLASLAWTRYRRDYLDIVEAFLGDPIPDDGTEARQLRDGLARLMVTGRSRSSAITVRSRALVRWEFTLADGTMRRLSEPEFIAELHEAVADVLADHRARSILLTDEIFDLGLPSWFRQSPDPRSSAGSGSSTDPHASANLHSFVDHDGQPDGSGQRAR